jgi:hypothetical protein
MYYDTFPGVGEGDGVNVDVVLSLDDVLRPLLGICCLYKNLLTSLKPKANFNQT